MKNIHLEFCIQFSILTVGLKNIMINLKYEKISKKKVVGINWIKSPLWPRMSF